MPLSRPDKFNWRIYWPLFGSGQELCTNGISNRFRPLNPVRQCCAVHDRLVGLVQCPPLSDALTGQVVWPNQWRASARSNLTVFAQFRSSYGNGLDHGQTPRPFPGQKLIGRYESFSLQGKLVSQSIRPKAHIQLCKSIEAMGKKRMQTRQESKSWNRARMCNWQESGSP
jgi:hypothetical protein